MLNGRMLNLFIFFFFFGFIIIIIIYFFCFCFQNSAQLFESNSVLPSSTNHITDQYQSNIDFTEDDSKRTIRKFNPNEAGGHDMISICILKMSDNAINKPLSTIFKYWLKYGMLPDDWKKETLYLYFKKATKKHQKLPSSLSSFDLQQDFWTYYIWQCVQIPLRQKILTSPKLAGFRPGNSCINWLLLSLMIFLLFFMIA